MYLGRGPCDAHGSARGEGRVCFEVTWCPWSVLAACGAGGVMAFSSHLAVTPAPPGPGAPCQVHHCDGRGERGAPSAHTDLARHLAKRRPWLPRAPRGSSWWEEASAGQLHVPTLQVVLPGLQSPKSLASLWFRLGKATWPDLPLSGCWLPAACWAAVGGWVTVLSAHLSSRCPRGVGRADHHPPSGTRRAVALE